MNKDEFKTLGKDLKHVFMDIVGNDVNNALNNAFEEVRKAVASVQAEFPQTQKRPSAQAQKQQVNKQPVPSYVYVPHSPVGKVAGVLLIVFGSIGLGSFGIAAAVLLIISSIGSSVFLIPLINVLSVLAAISGVLLARGISLRKRYSRYRMYLNLLNGRSTCMIKELALYSRQTEKFIIKDFRKMISKGMFPQAHIDDEKTMIMLNHETYNQYLIQQTEFKARKEEERLQAAERKRAKVTPEMSRTQATVEEGRKYIRQMNEAGTAITDPEVSSKIQRLEDTISRIIGYIEIHPEKLPEVRRFMAYYLPTTIKLLDAYKEFDRHPIQGSNITKAKSEIKDVLSTINSAFETLFDSLFENAAWDVSTDISVIKTIFQQEGLTNNNFKIP